MKTILHTASRALLKAHGGTEKSEQWFLQTITDNLTNFENITLYTGDATSDQFCLDFIRRHFKNYVYFMYKLDGSVECVGYNHPVTMACTLYWMKTEDIAKIKDKEPGRVPLYRNIALVNACPIDTLCLGYIAPWSKTNGTTHTVKQAIKRHLSTARFECPMEYRP